jgi:valyl-tRNA synthetase
VGEDRFVARKMWVKKLKEEGLLFKQENYSHNVGYSERTDAVVEPRISTQWFMDMQLFMKNNPEVLSSVMDDEIKFYPSKLKNTYRHWMENVKDWNISRQLWWGHRIPAWYNNSGEFVVAKTVDSAIELFGSKGINVTAQEIHQDPDVLDTWFSSWLWPISVFDGIGENANKAELDYYYPTNDLVTGPDILFFWVARMIMAGYEFEGKMPFKNVYFTGLIRDKQRRKMSKSLGNSPDALELIEKYGADAVRMGLLLCAPAGNDILFDESQIEQGRNFCNKIWNAFRLMSGWGVVDQPSTLAANKAQVFIDSRIQQVITENEKFFAEFKLSDALMNIYKLIWDDFCAVYLEAVKPPFGDPISKETLHETQAIFGQLMAMLHPYMPFISEEIHHAIHQGNPAKPLVISEYPNANESLSAFPMEPLLLVSEVRNLRNTKGLSPKECIQLWIPGNASVLIENASLIEKLANVQINVITSVNIPNGQPILVGIYEVWCEFDQTIDPEKEKEELNKDLNYYQGFAESVLKKLSNERFVSNAKVEVVDMERKKLADAQEKITLITKRLESL